MLLIGFVVWSAVTRRGVRHVLGWSGVGLLAAIIATAVVTMLLPPLPEIQEQLNAPGATTSAVAIPGRLSSVQWPHGDLAGLQRLRGDTTASEGRSESFSRGK